MAYVGGDAAYADYDGGYVGVNCGKLDQSCEVLCRKGSLLYLDCRDDSFELIPTNPAMKPYKIAVFFSGLERSLAKALYLEKRMQ